MSFISSGAFSLRNLLSATISIFQITAITLSTLLNRFAASVRSLSVAKGDSTLIIDDLGYLPQGTEESEVLFTLIAERCSLGITSNLVFSEWEKIFANPMVTAAAIDRIVHHSVIREFDMPSWRTGEAQERQLKLQKSR